jgi:hypothetical protein
MAVIEERKSKDGDITYRVKIRLKEHKPQEATFKRKTDAKNLATSTEGVISIFF